MWQRNKCCHYFFKIYQANNLLLLLLQSCCVVLEVHSSFSVIFSFLAFFFCLNSLFLEALCLLLSCVLSFISSSYFCFPSPAIFCPCQNKLLLLASFVLCLHAEIAECAPLSWNQIESFLLSK